ncbi:TetR/AcrR family transcriptional regulator [Halocella sp. SP3-1]|uniref:TetR/AcrR family transcriptional regulator n=1 Tax=Halocella sp. SP3-1 TaxID=2382161 RepID=UPI000F75250A|nr:TetR/AcrR family transcriptional regulator [Halocella sp. SP3-1]AZO94527.1 TetR/AcrR family transcriptional regulator [Halocella sp. SP3-1]
MTKNKKWSFGLRKGIPMPRHFSTQEQKIIRNKLIEKGKELIAIFGLKKTTISDLTKAVGISKGSFYNFFASKEELLFTIFKLEGNKLRKKISQEILNSSRDAAKSIKELIKLILKEMDDNPIINRIYNSDDLNYVYQKLSQEQWKENRELSVDALIPVIEIWQKEGRIIEKDPELIISVIRAVVFISLHKKEIGEEIYPETIDLLIDIVTKGLTMRR